MEQDFFNEQEVCPSFHIKRCNQGITEIMASRNDDSRKGSERTLKVGDVCICLEDSWEDLQNYRVRQVEPDFVIGPFTE